MGELKLGKHKLKTPAVCSPVIGKNLREMRAGVATAIKQGVDIVELRVDGLQDQRGWEKLLLKRPPVILTNRPEREGGLFKGEERDRVKLLLDGIKRGVPCIDIELSTPKKLRERLTSAARRSGTTVLMSHHDLPTTQSPNVLVDIVGKITEAGGDIAKIVTFAKNSDDAFRMLDFLIRMQGKKTIPIVAFAMGDAGRITRLVAPIFGSPFVYAVARDKTAPGQFDVATTKKILGGLT